MGFLKIFRNYQKKINVFGCEKERRKQGETQAD